MHQIAECVRHSIGEALLNARRLDRRQCNRTAGVCARAGAISPLLWAARARSIVAQHEPLVLPRLSRYARLLRDGLPGGLFFELIFGVDGSADSFDTDAVGFAFGFGVFARGAELVEAGLGGAVAIGAPSGLIACAAADAAAVFGASARGGVELVEAGLGGAVAIGGPSGLIACEAADGAAVFGA